MSVFDDFGGNNKFKPAPKSVGAFIDDAERYMEPFNGKITITKVDEIQNGDKKGSIIVHMTNARLKKENMEIRDGFFPPKKGTVAKVWRQTQVDRVTGAMKSAGVTPPEEVKMKELKGLLEQLVGKEVVISQWIKEGETMPRVNYKFSNLKSDANEDDEGEGDDEDEEVFD